MGYNASSENRNTNERNAYMTRRLALKAVTLLVAFGCGLVTVRATAATNTFSISLDTSALLDSSALVNRPLGPFSLAFCLSDGSGLGDANNTVTLSAFDFGGGSPTGSPNQFGGASGSLFSNVKLTDSLVLNCLMQQFSPGTKLTANVSGTNSIDNGKTQDVLVISILDRTGRPLITKTGQPFFNPLVAVVFDSPSPSLQNYALAAGPGAVAPDVGSMAQIASAGGWDTSVVLVNLGPNAAQARLKFFSDPSGGPLRLPFTFPQTPLSSLVTSTVDQTLNPNAVFLANTSGPLNQGSSTGWAQLQTDASVSGFGIFRFPQAHWEAVVPLETRNASSYLLAFDNTGMLSTGVAIANAAAQAANVPVIIRDDKGVQIGTATINLGAQGHTSFMLNQQYPVTANRLGTIEFDRPSGGNISLLGLRANGPALTTLPVLANVVSSGGGSITHAAYNGGWTSVFYLNNTGVASASFTLSFFDEGGNPLSVPLLLPQSGTTTSTSALTRTLAAGAMLVVETQANDAAATVVGSAQLTTTGGVSGFEIFRWITFGQEASVPLETRTPGSFVLVFDDTNGLTTGVALSNIAGSTANVTAKIYDDAGTMLQTASINLAGQGHTSFMLPDNYPSTANRRGMVEFVVPAGGKISAVGLRAKSDGTLTTIPVLTR